MRKLLGNKKILITAGPTWVPIDKIRVISNISSGLTGITIARRAAQLGANVTLFLGPVESGHEAKGIGHRVTVLRFKFFDELRELIRAQLKHEKYDIVIHGAAVADYKPVRTVSGKIRSGKKGLKIHLEPTVKIVDEIRRSAKEAFFVIFKLESGKDTKELIEIAYRNMRRCKADMVVANNIEQVSTRRHRAYIVDAAKRPIAVATKKELAQALLDQAVKNLKGPNDKDADCG